MEKINWKNFSKRHKVKNFALQLHIAALTVTVLFTFINLYLKLYYSSLCCFLSSLISVYCLYLYLKKDKFVLSNSVVFISLVVCLTALIYLEGVMSGYHLYFFTIIYGIPFFLRVRKNGISKLGSVVWYAVSIFFIIFSISISPLYSEVYNLSENVTYTKMLLNSVVSFIIIVVFSLLSIESTNKYARDLERGKRKAEEEKDSRTRVLSNLGHELRTQITSINGVIQLILENTEAASKVNKNEDDYFSILKYCNSKMLFLVNDILDMHKIEVGKFELFLESKKLGYVLSQITLPFVSKAKEKGIELKSVIDNTLYEVIVRVDASRLTQVLHNLISNAIKFTSDGYVEFKAKIKEDTVHGLKVVFSITDTGVGISKHNHNKIFDSFQQVKEEDKPIYGGTGLGLAISKTIVEKMNSKIEVESVVNLGSSFFFEVTFDKVETEQSTPALPNLAVHQAALIGKTILIVEDNAVNMLYTNKLIKKYGAETHKAENGKEAVDKVKRFSEIDLVLLDLEMPEMNGFTAIQHIKKIRPKLIVVAFTANITDQAMLERLEELGFDDIVSKPFKKEDLFRVINKYIEVDFSSNKNAS